MNEDIKRLVERLRKWPDSPDRRDDYSVASIQGLMNEAAQALASLTTKETDHG